MVAKRLILLALLALSGQAQAREIVLTSPSGDATLRLSDARGALHWSVALGGRPLLAPAPIGVDLLHAAAIRWRLGPPRVSSHDGIVTGLIGRASRARDRYRQILVAAGTAPGVRIALVARAYDDALAYRWVITTGRPLAVAGERGIVRLPAAAKLWAMPVPGFTSSYENFYRSGSVADVVRGQTLFVAPVLAHVPDAGWAAITEAALDDWAGLYLAPATGSRLAFRLSPRPDDASVAVRRAAGRNLSPWRVVLVGREPGDLIESNAITLLNPPPAADDWSWVKPGKTLFPWWNDYYWPGADFTPGLNTATYLALIDFAGANGIPYVTLDGYRDQAWYGGPIGPDGTPQDISRARREIDMPALLARARERGVRLRLWVHWQPLSEQLDTALDTWQRWGIAGFMVDFMDRDDQQMVDFYREVARKAALHRLTVSFHGAYKPTGEIRTWPNMLTREAVRNAEYNKFADKLPNNPDHEATVPFVRMLAGPLDPHQGGFNNVSAQAFRTRNTDPEVIGTRARSLALYVVDENPLPMLADSPANYQGAAGFAFAVATPSTWDETRVLYADPGHALVIARRSGSDWWIGAITDSSARRLTVSLARLGSGRYRIERWSDVAGASPSAVARSDARIATSDHLTITMAPAGGFAAHLVRDRMR